ncbi:MAG TPA: hypothetical protein VK668_05780 [Mucilaginibacter sp.]|nr:hypothetical protein [Mucilaginibacter sp.]
MNKIFTLLLISVVCLAANAQTTPPTQPYGKIDIADLQMKACDFEPDANAEILFDKGIMTSNGFERHVRVKVFNDFGKNIASVRLENVSVKDVLGGETFNLNDGKIEITPLNKKDIYLEKLDRLNSVVVFALPNVKAGSVVEFKYRGPFRGIWFFQNSIPTRYSEIQTDFPSTGHPFRFIPHIKQEYAKNVGEPADFKQTKALSNVRSLPDEPFMSARQSNLQRMEYNGPFFIYTSWPAIGELLSKLFDMDQNVDARIPGEKAILDQAKKLSTNDEKIAYIFGQVKNYMKWNDMVSFFAEDGASTVWNKKTGNSAEINWIVYHLLKKAGIKSLPMIVSTKSRGKLNPAIPDVFMLANMVVYLPIDTTKYYILDATSKYNLFNAIPTEELNTFGLTLDRDNSIFETPFIYRQEPVMQSVFMNAEIKPDGKMNGNAEITSYSYNKINAVKKYKTDGEEKYINYLRNDDNNLKISAIKMENMEVDSLPLTQKIDFGLELNSSNDNYMYFNTNLFTLMGANPFMKETRFSDIDFGYRDNYSISGMYKLPTGYKTDALPKSVTIVMPDGSIVFKRIIAEEEGVVTVRFVLDHKKSIYFRENYQDIRGFYKKMYELLNEQIVLKKS